MVPWTNIRVEDPPIFLLEGKYIARSSFMYGSEVNSKEMAVKPWEIEAGKNEISKSTAYWWALKEGLYLSMLQDQHDRNEFFMQQHNKDGSCCRASHLITGLAQLELAPLSELLIRQARGEAVPPVGQQKTLEK